MFIKLLKPFSFLPAILMMYVIFSFSSQDGVTSASLSYKVGYKIVETGGKIVGADFEPWEIDQLANRFQTPIRKIAHMSEYFLLSIAVAFPLYVYGLRGIWLMLVAGFFCVAFACGDEYHQSFVEGRGPSKRDVCIDSFGVFWGIICVRIIGWTGRHTIFAPFNKKKKKSKDAEYYGYQQMPYPNYPPNSNVYPPNGPVPAYQNPQQIHTAGAYPNQMGNQPSGPYPNQIPNQPAGPYPNQIPNQPAGPYPQPSYHGPYPQDYPNYRDTTSDNLSEDLSFKKLMRDIKDQRQESHSSKKMR